ncbi:hypothetical protein ABEW34_01825 [Paenibacillus algorifonticola]|uniref:hypothetical protein n=1 Tax=Paenibacillus algorifonticola TaxID=684063 RepID=UPI003D2DF79B
MTGIADPKRLAATRLLELARDLFQQNAALEAAGIMINGLTSAWDRVVMAVFEVLGIDSIEAGSLCMVICECADGSLEINTCIDVLTEQAGLTAKE